MTKKQMEKQIERYFKEIKQFAETNAKIETTNILIVSDNINTKNGRMLYNLMWGQGNGQMGP